MTEFDKGYLYGLVGTCVVFLLWDLVDAFIAQPAKPTSTKLVVLDRRDMVDNADHRTSDRMAGSGEVNPNA